MTERTYDLGELVKGTVDDVKAKLAEIPTAQLQPLRALEASGDNRSTLIEAIDHAIDERQGDLNPDGKDGAGTSDQDAKQADPARAGEARFTQADIDAAVAAERGRILDTQYDEATAPPRGKPIVIDPKANVPAMVALTGETRIGFVDSDDVPLAGTPLMRFEPGQFRPSGERAVLHADVSIPPAMPPGELAAAFLIDEEDTVVGKADLVQSFAVGGGRSTRIPGGTLAFAGAPNPAPKTAKKAA